MSVERKNHAIPGYKGFIPGMKNQTLFGKSFTEQSRDILRRELMDDTVNMYQSTGYNFILTVIVSTQPRSLSKMLHWTLLAGTMAREQ